MRSRAPLLALAAIALVAGAVALGTSMWRGGNPVEERALARLRARRAALHDSLDARIARDPMLSYARRHSSSVSLALAESVLTTVIEEVIVRYLDRIELDLEPDLDKHQGGDLNVDTPIGRLKAGEWDVVVGIRQIDGVLAARRATVAVTGTNRVHVVIPTEVREGHGAVTLDFKWDSKAAFNLLCRDFKASSAVRGTILPQRHVVRGDLVLSASEDGIVVDPEFPREKFPLSMTLTPESWKEIRKVLEEQDVPTRCGVLMKPDKVIEHLRALGLRGIKVRLPKKIFRTFVLPASLTKSVRILDSHVRLSVVPDQLRIQSGVVWYGAEVEAARGAGSDSLLPWPATK